MVAGKRGWARLGLGLYWTDDGGREWRQITPPLHDPADLRGAYFRDQRYGWTLAEEGTEGTERQVIFSTADGGRSWLRTPLRIKRLLLPAASVSFSALDDRRIFALVRRSGDTASNFGILSFSGDGGRSWRQIRPYPPQAGEIVFDRDGTAGSRADSRRQSSGEPATVAATGQKSPCRRRSGASSTMSSRWRRG
jgi:photosystem II stability/assembly factor-like uncharacterized protein